MTETPRIPRRLALRIWSAVLGRGLTFLLRSHLGRLIRGLNGSAHGGSRQAGNVLRNGPVPTISSDHDPLEKRIVHVDCPTTDFYFLRRTTPSLWRGPAPAPIDRHHRKIRYAALFFPERPTAFPLLRLVDWPWFTISVTRLV